jgi:hypothetical protein
MIMIARNKRPGRPPKFVHDESGKPIIGLSFDKTNNSYYATYSNPRVNFGSDFPTALLEFRKWENSQVDEEPCVEIELPNPPDFAGTKIIEWDDDLAKDPPIIRAAYAGDTLNIPESMFTRVKTVLNYSMKKGRNNKDELTRVLAFCKCLTVEVPNEESAKPIERQHFHTLLNHCSIKWRSILLLALNCGYYRPDLNLVQLDRF